MSVGQLVYIFCRHCCFIGAVATRGFAGMNVNAVTLEAGAIRVNWYLDNDEISRNEIRGTCQIHTTPVTIFDMIYGHPWPHATPPTIK